MISVSAFRWVPPFARGLVRDLRVRWALEEAGLPYEALLIGQEDQSSAKYRAMQPFGQVPAFED
ncbi:MAG TPA: glutathione S-transferase N-terminal domain-containing protein, partial [Pseudolabrys sp.]